MCFVEQWEVNGVEIKCVVCVYFIALFTINYIIQGYNYTCSRIA